jgi:hypothetical protein
LAAGESHGLNHCPVVPGDGIPPGAVLIHEKSVAVCNHPTERPELNRSPDMYEGSDHRVCASTTYNRENPHDPELRGASMFSLGQQADLSITRERAPKRFERQWVSMNITAINNLLTGAPNDCEGGVYTRVMELLAKRDDFVAEQLEALEGGAA